MSERLDGWTVGVGRANPLDDQMPGAEFEEMARLAASDARLGLDARIARERRVQTRARRTRTICRYITLIGGLAAISFMFVGLRFNLDRLTGLGCQPCEGVRWRSFFSRESAQLIRG